MKKLIFLLSTFALISGASAQSMNELFSISQQYNTFSTARIAGMGGAFTSLGADVGSINVNPAGIAMYRSKGAFSVTPAINTASAKGFSYANANQTETLKNNKTTGELSNIGIVYNSQLGNGLLKNVAFGFSYNSGYSNEYNATVNGLESGSSILDMYSAQLVGIPVSDVENFKKIGSASLYGAAGAYNSGMIYNTNDKDNIYSPGYILNGQEVGSLVTGDMVFPELLRYVDERSEDYNFALGFNLGDKVYFGASMGYSEYHSKQFDDYSEYTPNTNQGDMDNMLTEQSLYKNGSAFNFLFGVTVQPTNNLRVGASVQAPKIFTIDEEYSTYSYAEFYEGNSIASYDYYSPVLMNRYKVKTPTKLSIGASYALGKVALLSVDYEKVWNNQTRLRFEDNYGYVDVDTDAITKTFKASDNIRAGVEINIPGNVVLRGGYASYGNPFKVETEGAGSITGIKNITGGIGYKMGGFSIDLSYINVNAKTSAFRMYEYYSPEYNQTFQSTSLSKINLINHNVMVTFGWRM